jgi:predicted ATPase
MIRSLRLINFKAFENELFELRPLTLLSGLNSTGKSSVIQSLLLLRQSYEQELLEEIGLALNGDLVEIGNAQDAFYENASDDYIEFAITDENNKQGVWRFNYELENKETELLDIDFSSSTKPGDAIYESNIFNKRLKFHYLQAERIGPRLVNDMSDYKVRRLKQIGTKGEYTGHFLNVYGRKPIPIANLAYPQAKSMDLIDQVEGWMREVSPGTRITINSYPDIGMTNSQYSYGDSNLRRSTNVGFGISYTLPILVAVLSSEPGTLILIENPEAHLHPKGQAKIGELLALAASCDIQVVIETHSDHVLNGIRVAVHDGKLHPGYVQLHYLQRKENRGLTFTEVVSPHIDRNGRIDKWPDNFFDEWDKSLDALLEPAGE